MATAGVSFDQELHDELMAMFRRDQAGRAGGIDNEGDDARTQRLKEIIAEHGWPTIDLVGEDGADAAPRSPLHSLSRTGSNSCGPRPGCSRCMSTWTRWIASATNSRPAARAS